MFAFHAFACFLNSLFTSSTFHFFHFINTNGTPILLTKPALQITVTPLEETGRLHHFQFGTFRWTPCLDWVRKANKITWPQQSYMLHRHFCSIVQQTVCIAVDVRKALLHYGIHVAITLCGLVGAWHPERVTPTGGASSYFSKRCFLFQFEDSFARLYCCCYTWLITHSGDTLLSLACLHQSLYLCQVLLSVGTVALWVGISQVFWKPYEFS